MKYPIIYGNKTKSSDSKTSCSITSCSKTSSNDPIILDSNGNIVVKEE